MQVLERGQKRPPGRAGDVRIKDAAEALGVTPHWLRMLEYRGRIPEARYDRGGRLFSEEEIEMLRRMGIGSSPPRLLRPEEIE